MRCFGIVPPLLLQRIAESSDPDLCERARRTLELDAGYRGGRMVGPRPAQVVPGPAGPRRTISDAAGREELPGTVVRTEGQPPTGDPAADEAYDALGATYDLYAQAFDRDSVDGAGAPLDATVHYGQGYDNAFWQGERMVFGDGDGRVFGRFTRPVGITGHELTHGVTQHTANLGYMGQTGALNESVSDVFGSLVKQHSQGQSADQADWLIGEGIFLPGVRGTALRSLKAPGTAYDDPVLGKDPQPATMSGYVETSEDNGGVHINSGIPNHAFYLVAVALGGHAWERAGRVWYEALTGGSLPSDADFAAFARTTLEVAARLFGTSSTEADEVRRGWSGVGIEV